MTEEKVSVKRSIFENLQNLLRLRTDELDRRSFTAKHLAEENDRLRQYIDWKSTHIQDSSYDIPEIDQIYEVLYIMDGECILTTDTYDGYWSGGHIPDFFRLWQEPK